MARQKNGWIKLYASVLDKDLTLVNFKIWAGLLLIANTLKSKNAGLVDLPLREIAKRLRVSTGALIHARDKFIADDMIEIVKLPSKTKPIYGLKIINYELYQGKKFVSSNEHSPTKKVPQDEHSLEEIVSPSEQKVHAVEQSVSPSEHSPIQNAPTKNNKEYTKKKDHAPKKVKEHDFLNEERKLVFQGLKKRRGYNSGVAGAEAKAITWMLQQGYAGDKILSAYDKLKKDKFWADKFLSMQSVKAQIGELVKAKCSKGTAEQPTTEELKKSWGIK